MDPPIGGPGQLVPQRREQGLEASTRSARGGLRQLAAADGAVRESQPVPEGGISGDHGVRLTQARIAGESMQHEEPQVRAGGEVFTVAIGDVGGGGNRVGEQTTDLA